MVVEGEDGYLGMTYSDAGVIAIKAIQEQQTIIEEQQATIYHQEEKNETLEKEIALLKSQLEATKDGLTERLERMEALLKSTPIPGQE